MARPTLKTFKKEAMQKSGVKEAYDALALHTKLEARLLRNARKLV